MAKNNTKEKLNAKKGDLPEKKVQITKEYMRDYIKYQANTPENIEWFKALCNKFKVKKTTKALGEHFDIDVAEVRKEFIDRFFADKFKKDEEVSFFDSLDDFFAD